MTNALTTFNYNTATIRVIDIDGEPWFVAKDVTDALTLKHITNALLNCNQTEVQDYRIPGTRGRPHKLVSESGLYKLIMRSDKPEARAFQDWVTGTVLPAIRKDGGYIMGEEKVTTGEMTEDELVLKAVSILQDKVERLKRERDEAKQEQAVATSMVTSANRTLNKVLRMIPGVNTQKGPSDLMNLGYLYRRGGHYRVYSKYQHLFSEKVDEVYGKATIVPTDKGVELLHSLVAKGLMTMKVSHAR